MDDEQPRFCIYCWPKRHPEVQPDGSVVEVEVPPRHHLCAARGSPGRYCECACPWLEADMTSTFPTSLRSNP